MANKVELTISGDKGDVAKVFNELISRVVDFAGAVDFEVTPQHTKIFLYSKSKK